VHDKPAAELDAAERIGEDMVGTLTSAKGAKNRGE
jgi:hypothetical protein